MVYLPYQSQINTTQILIRLSDLSTYRLTNKPTERQTDRKTDRKKDRQIHRQKDRQIDRQTERQTDRQTDRPKLLTTDLWQDGQSLNVSLE